MQCNVEGWTIVLAHSLDLPESCEASEEGPRNTSKGRSQDLTDILDDNEDKQRNEAVDVVSPVRALPDRLLHVGEIYHNHF
jgi:hypothetical protein